MFTFHGGTSQDGSKSCGSLQMKFQWLTLSDEVSPDIAPWCGAGWRLQGLQGLQVSGATGLWGSQRILNFRASNMSEDLINKNWDLDTFSDRYRMIGMLVYNWATFMDVSSMVRWMSWTTLYPAKQYGRNLWRSNQFPPRNDAAPLHFCCSQESMINHVT